MDKTLLIYTGITVFYILLLIVYFWRRSRKHENELKGFLSTAKKQLDEHKKHVHTEAQTRIEAAMHIIKKLQKLAENLENQSEKEYNQIVDDAKAKAKVVIDEAHEKAKNIMSHADDDLEDYRQQRRQEVEADMVKLVISVTEKVLGQGLHYQDHVQIIHQAMEEIKQQKEKL